MNVTTAAIRGVEAERLRLDLLCSELETFRDILLEDKQKLTARVAELEADNRRLESELAALLVRLADEAEGK